jgi:hypothetical protein
MLFMTRADARSRLMIPMYHIVPKQLLEIIIDYADENQLIIDRCLSENHAHSFSIYGHLWEILWCGRGSCQPEYCLLITYEYGGRRILRFTSSRDSFWQFICGGDLPEIQKIIGRSELSILCRIREKFRQKCIELVQDQL